MPKKPKAVLAHAAVAFPPPGAAAGGSGSGAANVPAMSAHALGPSGAATSRANAAAYATAVNVLTTLLQESVTDSVDSRFPACKASATLADKSAMVAESPGDFHRNTGTGGSRLISVRVVGEPSVVC